MLIGDLHSIQSEAIGEVGIIPFTVISSGYTFPVLFPVLFSILFPVLFPGLHLCVHNSHHRQKHSKKVEHHVLDKLTPKQHDHNSLGEMGELCLIC